MVLVALGACGSPREPGGAAATDSAELDTGSELDPDATSGPTEGTGTADSAADDSADVDHGECVAGIEGMACVPAGSFWRGCNDRIDDACDPSEFPYHEVTLDEYWIDIHETTVGEYRACVDAEVCSPPAVDASTNGVCNWDTDPDDHPVSCITWSQADIYCAWRGKRLPTEAEWEQAARGRDGRRFPWGSELPSCERAVINDGEGPGCGTGGLLPVGSKPAGASPYGVMDLLGGVMEWVWDRYGAYDAEPQHNPTGPEDGVNRVVRGSSFRVRGTTLRTQRVSKRFTSPPDTVSGYFGLRCASSP